MGAGKSYLGIMAFLPYIHIPYFRGLMTRRTTPQLTGPGGLLDVATDMFRKVDPKVRWRSQDREFVFSSGAKIALRHFEYEQDELNFQGLQANLILIDEAQQYTERQVVYLRGRNRNPRCPECKPRMLLTCNPEKHSFLRKWLDYWLDDKGFPIQEYDSTKRHFIRLNNQMYWADTPEELIEAHSNGRDPCIPTSVSFISANVYDNPVLMETQPEYIGNLLAMGRVEQDKFLHGCWDAELESSGYWKKEWCEVVPLAPREVIKKVRAWDISGSIPSEINRDPDYTCGVLMSKDKYGSYYVEDVIRFRARHGEVFEKMCEVAQQDGSDTLIVVPCDPGASGKQYASTLIRDLAERGFYAKSKQTSKSKVQRFAPFAAACEAGVVKLVAGEWHEWYIPELESFDGGRKGHDDAVDSSADAFVMLASAIKIPTFAPPDLSVGSTFDFSHNQSAYAVGSTF